jgi:uncharacterized membrane protein YgcG
VQHGDIEVLVCSSRRYVSSVTLPEYLQMLVDSAAVLSTEENDRLSSTLAKYATLFSAP